MYTDVYKHFTNILLSIIVWNVFETIVNLIKLNFKGNKGILKYINKMLLLAPAVKFILFAILISKRLLFESRVCFCDFKD